MNKHKIFLIHFILLVFFYFRIYLVNHRLKIILKKAEQKYGRF